MSLAMHRLPMTLVLLLALALAALSACTPFHLPVPDEMVEVPVSRHAQWDMRATSVDGVIVAVRTVRVGENQDVPRGDLTFWTESITRALSDDRGYALISTDEIRSANGVAGRALRFGRDFEDTEYRYELHVYLGRRFLHIVEAGGLTEAFEARRSHVDAARAEYVVKR